MATVAESGIRAYHSPRARGNTPAGAAPAGFPLLVDAALERIALARRRMAHGRRGETNCLLEAAWRLVTQLRGGLDALRGDSYAANLDDVCEYVARQLVAAKAQAGAATLDEASHLLREIRTAWLVYV